jgi:transcriptional regulator with XRE-family HTH domain
VPTSPKSRPRPGEDNNVVGRRLRELRNARGLSARKVADRASVSAAYLSRVENGHISPTVSTLQRIVQAMDESVARVFGEVGTGPVVRKENRRLVRNRGVDDYFVTPTESGRLEVLETTIEPGADSGSEPYSHPGDEECVLVIEGRLLFWLDGTRYQLDCGDSITFPCRSPHRWANNGQTDTRVLWIITPAGY